jgi:cysteine desulfurase
MLKDIIYLDYNAATPTDPRVLQGMLPYFSAKFGNAASRAHSVGWEAERAVEDARIQVLNLIGAKSPDEIIFTSGATESNNLAIKGVLEARGGGHIVTSSIEHPCVLNTCAYLQRHQVDCTQVAVDRSGVISPAAIEAAIRPDTALISVMAVNHEIGTIQPVREIAAIANRHGIPFHCDAAQATGKIPLDVHHAGIDLLSISAHKFYGPKGIGALYVRRNPRTVPLSAQMIGGGQERGYRSGTLNVPGIVGLGLACRYAGEEMEVNIAKIRSLRARFIEQLERRIPDVHIHGCFNRRIAGNLNLALGEIPSEKLINTLKNVAISGGSACSSGTNKGSPVLRAMGYGEVEAARAVRIGFSHLTTELEVDQASKMIADNACRLARLIA